MLVKSNQIVSWHLEANFMCWLLYFLALRVSTPPESRCKTSIRRTNNENDSKTQSPVPIRLCRLTIFVLISHRAATVRQFCQKSGAAFCFPPAEDVLGEQRSLAPTQKGRETKRPVSGDSTQNIFTIVNPPELTVSSCTSTPRVNAADGPLPAERADNRLSRWRL